MAYAYIVAGSLMIVWGGSKARRSLRPFCVRPFLLITLGIIMVYKGTQMDM